MVSASRRSDHNNPRPTNAGQGGYAREHFADADAKDGQGRRASQMPQIEVFCRRWNGWLPATIWREPTEDDPRVILRFTVPDYGLCEKGCLPDSENMRGWAPKPKGVKRTEFRPNLEDRHEHPCDSDSGDSARSVEFKAKRKPTPFVPPGGLPQDDDAAHRDTSQRGSRARNGSVQPRRSAAQQGGGVRSSHAEPGMAARQGTAANGDARRLSGDRQSARRAQPSVQATPLISVMASDDSLSEDSDHDQQPKKANNAQVDDRDRGHPKKPEVRKSVPRGTNGTVANGEPRRSSNDRQSVRPIPSVQAAPLISVMASDDSLSEDSDEEQQPKKGNGAQLDDRGKGRPQKAQKPQRPGARNCAPRGPTGTAAKEEVRKVPSQARQRITILSEDTDTDEDQEVGRANNVQADDRDRGRSQKPEARKSVPRDTVGTAAKGQVRSVHSVQAAPLISVMASEDELSEDSDEDQQPKGVHDAYADDRDKSRPGQPSIIEFRPNNGRGTAADADVLKGHHAKVLESKLASLEAQKASLEANYGDSRQALSRPSVFASDDDLSEDTDQDQQARNRDEPERLAPRKPQKPTSKAKNGTNDMGAKSSPDIRQSNQRLPSVQDGMSEDGMSEEIIGVDNFGGSSEEDRRPCQKNLDASPRRRFGDGRRQPDLSYLEPSDTCPSRPPNSLQTLEEPDTPPARQSRPRPASLQTMSGMFEHRSEPDDEQKEDDGVAHRSTSQRGSRARNVSVEPRRSAAQQGGVRGSHAEPDIAVHQGVRERNSSAEPRRSEARQSAGARNSSVEPRRSAPPRQSHDTPEANVNGIEAGDRRSQRELRKIVPYVAPEMLEGDEPPMVDGPSAKNNANMKKQDKRARISASYDNVEKPVCTASEDECPVQRRKPTPYVQVHAMDSDRDSEDMGQGKCKDWWAQDDTPRPSKRHGDLQGRQESSPQQSEEDRRRQSARGSSRRDASRQPSWAKQEGMGSPGSPERVSRMRGTPESHPSPERTPHVRGTSRPPTARR